MLETGLPSKAISWMRMKSGNSASLPWDVSTVVRVRVSVRVRVRVRA